MESNFDKLEFLANQELDQYAEMHHPQGTMRQISEQIKTIAVQREIIAEQAVKIQVLQEKLKKYGWNV